MDVRRALATILLLLVAPSAQAVESYAILGDDVEAVTLHHAIGAWQTLVGAAGFLPSRTWAVSGHAALGSYGYEALSGGAGLAVQTNAFTAATLGLAFTAFDAEFETRVLGASVSLPASAATADWLRCEGALLWQWDVDAGSSVAIPSEGDSSALVLIDDISWWHGQGGVSLRAPWRVLRPTASLALLVSRYAYEGHLCPDDDCFTAGPATEDQGWITHVVWDLGLEAQLGPVRPYVGVAAVSDAVVMVARLTLVSGV